MSKNQWRMAVIYLLAFGSLQGVGVPDRLRAQQIGISTPFSTMGDSWYERTGVNFGFSIPGGNFGPGGSRVVGLLPNGQINPSGNIVFSQNGAASTIPAFGGYDPGAAGRFGFGSFGRGGGGFSLGLEFGKGSTRTMTSTTPSMIVQNGAGGTLFSGSARPFVTGLTPFVGNGGAYDGPPVNGVTLAMESGQLDLSQLGKGDRPVSTAPSEPVPQVRSTASVAVSSVRDIQQRKQREKELAQIEVQEQLTKAEAAIAAGDLKAAKLAYYEAVQRETDPARKRKLTSQYESVKQMLKSSNNKKK